MLGMIRLDMSNQSELPLAIILAVHATEVRFRHRHSQGFDFLLQFLEVF